MKKWKAKAGSMPMAIGWGLLVSVLVTVVTCALVAAAVAGGWIQEESVGYGALMILLLSAAGGSAAAGLCHKAKLLPVCLGSGLSYYVFLLCCTGLFFEGAYGGMLPSAAAILGSSGAVALLMARGSGTGKRRHWKYKAA